MDIDWSDAVMRMSGAVTLAEARVDAQATILSEAAGRGQDVAAAALLLQSHERSLALRRGVRAYLVGKLEGAEAPATDEAPIPA